MIDRARGPAAPNASRRIAHTLALLAMAACGGCEKESPSSAVTASPEAGSLADGPATPDTPSDLLPDLVIEDIQVGSGPAIGEGSWAVVHSLITGDGGSVIENTRASGRPAEMFLPGGYIKGLSQGLMGMRPGGTRTLTIPAPLAYDDDPPARSGLSPGETLHATIECLQVLNEPDIILPSGLKIITDGRGEGPAARYGSWVSVQVLMTAGNDQRVVYDSRARGGPIEIGLPAPVGVVVGRRYEPEIPWLDPALYGIRAGEFRQVVVPPQLAFGGRGYVRLAISPGEGVALEISCLDVHDEPRKELAGGLVVEDLEEGDGRYVRMGLFATIREELTLEDGTVIYSSLAESEPVVMTMIPRTGPDGWNRGMTGMRAGGVRRLTIPPDLAFGDRSPRNFPAIPPGATIRFTVRLLELNDRPPAPPARAGN